VTYSLATFQGRIRDNGGSMVPSCIVSVLTAAARRDTQASIPHTDSQIKKSPQPWSSAMAANSTASLALGYGMTTLHFISDASR